MKTSKLRVIGLCAGYLPVIGEFPAQMANNAENVSIWWRHHVGTLIIGGYLLLLDLVLNCQGPLLLINVDINCDLGMDV